MTAQPTNRTPTYSNIEYNAVEKANAWVKTNFQPIGSTLTDPATLNDAPVQLDIDLQPETVNTKHGNSHKHQQRISTKNTEIANEQYASPDSLHIRFA